MNNIEESEKFLRDEIERIGKSVNRDELAKENFVPLLKKEFELVFLKTTQNLYYIMQDHPLTYAFCAMKGELNEAETLNDYYDNLRKMQSASEIIATNMKKYKKSGLADMDSVFSSYAKSREQYSAFLELISSYVSSAIYLESCSKSNNAYLKQLSKTLPVMRKKLVEATKYLESWKRYGSGHSELYQKLLEFFDQVSSGALEAIQAFQEEEKRLKELQEVSKSAVVVNTGKKVEIAPNQKEEERINAINKANMMYHELCENTMRDLERQVPYSAREMYDYFVNVKFAKFVKSFDMPLSKDTSLKTAKEVCYQLNELNNYISKISENAQTTNIYMMKE